MLSLDALDFWRDLRSEVGGRVWFAVALIVAVGLTEGFGVLLLVPLLQLTGLDVQQGAAASLTRFITAGFGRVGLSPTLPVVLSLFALVITFQTLLYRWQTILMGRIVYEFAQQVRQRLYIALVRSSWLFYSRRSSSEFAYGLTVEVDRIAQATQFLLMLLATGAVTMAYVVLAMRLSVAMILVVSGCAATLVLLLRSHTHRARRSGEGLSEVGNALYAATLEHLGGMKTVKSYGAEERNIDIFGSLTGGLAGRHVEATVEHANLRAWSNVGGMLVLCGVLYIAIRFLALPTADILLLVFLFARIMPRVATLQQTYQHFVSVLPSYAAVRRLESEATAARESGTLLPRPDRVGSERQTAPRLELISARSRSGPPTVTFEHVSFRYAADRPWVVDHVTLSLMSGRTTALVGISGSGKSTLADLAMGLVVPEHGQILIDGQPLDSTQLAAWRARIGYVAQDTFLFNASVRANLLWANPQATVEDIGEALRSSAADTFVGQLPETLETRLGDRGQWLSGGERQRLALARALLRRPALLILDEATSNIDAEHERQIQERIDALHGRITILTITHRLAAVRNADIIHVLEQGRLLESGTWTELAARGDGRFAALLAVHDQ